MTNSKEKNIIELTEDDIKKFLKHRGTRYYDFWDKVWDVCRFLMLFLALFFFFFVAINLPAYYQKSKYFWENTIQGKKYNFSNVDHGQKEINSIDVKDINKFVSKSEKINTFLLQYVKNDTLIVPSLKINAPVVWNSNQQNIYDNLHNGVAHYEGTALPGENGNVFITGHSSNYWWDKGNYNQVFSLLDSISLNERIYLAYQNQPYVFLVEDSKVVTLDNIEVMDPKDHSIITLMTCTPVGTTLNRRIVQARQIYPIPPTSEKITPPTIDKLPTIR